MIPLQPEAAARLAAATTSLAFCWKLLRADGVALGFTSHDRDLVIDGLVYRASPGIAPSAISLNDGFDAAAMEVTGALTSDAIAAQDLEAGRYDQARVAVFLVDWEAPETLCIGIARGTLGNIRRNDNGFAAEMRRETSRFDRAVTEQMSPECRAQLGDRRCRIDLAARTRMVRIVAVADPVTLTLAESEPSPNAYACGRLRWIEGANAGFESEIVASSGASVTLREPPPFGSAPDLTVELREGCNKAFATCRDRFANAVNFRGEPHVPGNDLLTRYPGL